MDFSSADGLQGDGAGGISCFDQLSLVDFIHSSTGDDWQPDDQIRQGYTPMRLLFLGNNFHPLSIASLGFLSRVDRYSLLAGIAGTSEGGAVVMARKILGRYGLPEFLRRGKEFAVAKTRMKLRGLGLPLKGARTVEELLGLTRTERFGFSNINHEDTLARIRQFSPDLIVVAAFSQILRGNILKIPSLGAVNVHLSLLPKYRGPVPCHWVIRNKERFTGVTVHYIDEGTDTGDIILQSTVEILPGESPSSLEKRLSPIGAELLIDVLDRIESGNVSRTKQNEKEASYYSFPGE